MKQQFEAFGKLLAPGLNVRNESSVPILVTLSQVSPLHWAKVEPGQSHHFQCGRVHFTANVEVYEEKKVPTELGVALKIGAITATAFISNGLFLIPSLVAGGLTSQKDQKIIGCLADGKTLVVKDLIVGEQIAGVYFYSQELGKN